MPTTPDPPPKNVWILDEGSHGHLVQSRGLIRELGKLVPVVSSELSVRPAFASGLGRSIAKRLLPRFQSSALLRTFYPQFRMPDRRPDLIVSSGPQSLPALQYLARLHDCPSVFVQGTLAVPEGSVTAIMRPFEGTHRADYIFIPLLFTDITPSSLEAAAAEFLQHHPLARGPVTNALFIGASSSKIPFGNDDWAAIADFVNALWKSDGSRWLITTSYRTGSDVEAILKQRIDPAALLDSVWYSQAPRRVTQPFLGLADRVFVTVDSLTMLTEAVASGKPVYALSPARLDGDPSNTHLRYVHGLAESGRVALIRPHESLALPDLSSTERIDYHEAIHQLLQQIHWTS